MRPTHLSKSRRYFEFLQSVGWTSSTKFSTTSRSNRSSKEIHVHSLYMPGNNVPTGVTCLWPAATATLYKYPGPGKASATFEARQPRNASSTSITQPSYSLPRTDHPDFPTPLQRHNVCSGRSQGRWRRCIYRTGTDTHSAPTVSPRLTTWCSLPRNKPSNQQEYGKPSAEPSPSILTAPTAFP